MCSIIGCRWGFEVASSLVKSLKKMEYRGYDSVGLATLSCDNIETKKGIGKVNDVNESIGLEFMPGHVGIGHTRWATHGKVSVENSHPHLSQQGNVAIVHNGIIDNYEEIRKSLRCEFKSETDSEVIAALLGMHFSETCDAGTAMKATVAKLKGNYAFIALFNNGVLAAARSHEPLIVGVASAGYFLASDVIGFIEYTEDAIYVDNKEYVIVNPEKVGDIEFYTFQGAPVSHKIVKLSKELVDSNKEEYAHFTIKEINEQPSTILKAGTGEQFAEICSILGNTEKIFITGSGTSYNAALVAKHLFSQYTTAHVDSIISSEGRFSAHGINNKSVLLAISQSGESADVLDTVQMAQERGAKIVSIVNTTTSSLARMSSSYVSLNCGAEIGVAATKSFTSQLAILYDITCILSPSFINDFDNNLVSEKMKIALKETKVIKEVAKALKDVRDVYILGRGIHYAIASEASLKLKEITYIHAEGLPGGELKHGPLALIDEQSYVILIAPLDATHHAMMNSAQQIRSRGAKIIGISNWPSAMFDYWLPIPEITEIYYPLIEIIPIQLLSYYLAVERNVDPDYPKNLAKSCTTF